MGPSVMAAMGGKATLASDDIWPYAQKLLNQHGAGSVAEILLSMLVNAHTSD
jgi:hypothetical protein